MAKKRKNKNSSLNANAKIAKLKISRKRTRAEKPKATKKAEAASQISASKVEKEQGNDTARLAEKGNDNTYLAKWTAPEFIKTKEETLFYYVSIVASIFMVIWATLSGNFITAITFLLLIVVIVMQIRHEPVDIESKIDLDGIMMGGKLYKYETIESFEVDQKNGFNILKFKLKNSILPNKEIYLGTQDAYYINAALEYFLPVEKQEETLMNFESKSKQEEKDYEYAKEEDYCANK